jgi:hypothetical protein
MQVRALARLCQTAKNIHTLYSPYTIYRLTIHYVYTHHTLSIYSPYTMYIPSIHYTLICRYARWRGCARLLRTYMPLRPPR